MAGPGGGPPRKSHTKSRKGCKTCKKRHIRCDELFPQCRNCTKHNCRCDYMDMPTANDELLQSSIGSKTPDLLITPEAEHAILFWKSTGEPPYPDLRIAGREYWTRFSTIDLRLIHHIAGLSIQLHQQGYSVCTIWAQKMPVLLEIALGNDFVMSAILALSASHLAWQTENQETEQLSAYHRGGALKGLHEAIGSFSRENSDAILAASMLLSWQATEWKSWASLQQGVSTVINAMRPWVHESKLASYLRAQRSLSQTRTPATPGLPGQLGHSRPEDLARLDRAISALFELQGRLANNPEMLEWVKQLLIFLQQLRQDFPLQAPEEAFERLQQLRSWLFWLPPAILRPDGSDHGAFAVMAHYFAIAIALDPLFPEIGGAYLGAMSVAPVEEMRRILLTRRASHPTDAQSQIALALMESPWQMVNEHKSRQQQLAEQSLMQNSAPRSPYAMPTRPLASTPDLAPAALFHNSPMHSPSTATLSVPGSPYFPAPTHGRSMSQFVPQHHSPALRPQSMAERSQSFHSPLGMSQAAYPGGYLPLQQQENNNDWIKQEGYREHVAFQANTTSGFVVPAQLWT